jgi:hypothetical protein
MAQSGWQLSYGQENQRIGVRFLIGASIASRPALEPTQAPTHIDTEGYLLIRQKREANNSRPSSAEFKNGGAIFPPSVRLHDVMFN